MNMTISDESWSNKLRQIGDIERPDHSYLTPEHNCYYFGEYTSGEGYSHSSTNSIVNNIKKPPSTRETPQWKYKLEEIDRVGSLIRNSLKPEAISSISFVPAPPSKPPSDPDYDDRILQLSRAAGEDIDIRPLLETVQARDPAHLRDDLRSPDVLVAGMRFCPEHLESVTPVGTHIILLDDVIVTGATFVSCRQILLSHIPDARVSGLFVARRVLEGIDLIDEFGD